MKVCIRHLPVCNLPIGELGICERCNRAGTLYDERLIKLPVDVSPEGIAAAIESVGCEECGMLLGPGDWPFCPHGKGAYHFKTRMGMKLNGWNKSKV